MPLAGDKALGERRRNKTTTRPDLDGSSQSGYAAGVA